MFKADQSIQSAKEDKLNRTSFAHSLAEAILDYEERESLVLGLFGEWGSGKTSILNLALEQIASISERKSNKEKPIIVRFNPLHKSLLDLGRDHHLWRSTGNRSLTQNRLQLSAHLQNHSNLGVCF